jgi:Tyrosine-protein kinase ephrin type A/B receptor-like
LQILHLKNNDLTGTIPYHFGELPYISWFDISNNRMHGQIPTGFGKSRTLTDFRLAGNMIYNPIPPGLCSNTNINDGATAEAGCDGIACAIGSYSDIGHAADGECEKCPDGETTLYLGATSCETLSESDILSIFYGVMHGDEWPAETKANWGLSSVNSCEWAGIACNTDGEIVSLSFPLLNQV